MSSFEVVLHLDNFSLLSPQTWNFSVLRVSSNWHLWISEKEHVAPGNCTDFEGKRFLSGLILCFTFWIFLSWQHFGFRVTKTSPALIGGTKSNNENDS